MVINGQEIVDILKAKKKAFVDGRKAWGWHERELAGQAISTINELLDEIKAAEEKAASEMFDGMGGK